MMTEENTTRPLCNAAVRTYSQVRTDLHDALSVLVNELPTGVSEADAELADVVDAALAALERVRTVAAIIAHRVKIAEAQRTIRAANSAIERLEAQK